MDVENILKIITAVSESELTEFSYEEGDVKGQGEGYKCLKLSKHKEQTVIQSMAGTESLQIPAIQPIAQQEPTQTSNTSDNEETAYQGNKVKSPLVGTFYSAPSPEDKPYVQVGDTVKKGQTLGIVEAMKLMNEIESEYDGEVKAILVENEEIVEYGQPLFIIG